MAQVHVVMCLSTFVGFVQQLSYLRIGLWVAQVHVVMCLSTFVGFVQQLSYLRIGLWVARSM